MPDRVVILAGGDCAMDAARCAERLGAKDIFIVFGGPRSAMHWHMAGDWFGETGHHGMMECEALGYVAGPDGRLAGLRVSQNDRESMLEAGLVIEAMGLRACDTLRGHLSGVAFNEHGLVAAGDGALTSRAGVYAAGGLVNGGASVARCIAEGLAAAEQIDRDLMARACPGVSDEPSSNHEA